MDSLFDRYGPWALVTGASSGVGAAFARRLADEGFSLVLVARTGTALQALATRLDVPTRILPVDLRAEGSVRWLADRVSDLDLGLVVNNAGALELGPLEAQTVHETLALHDLNTRVPLELTRRLLPSLVARDRAALVYLSSFVAFRGAPWAASYGASKAWSLGLAESLGPELAEDAVDVLAVCPGFVDTPMIAPFRARIGGPMGLMKPEAVVSAALRALGRRYSVVPGRRNVWLQRILRWLPRDVAARIMARSTARLFRPTSRPGTSPRALPGPQEPGAHQAQ